MSQRPALYQWHHEVSRRMPQLSKPLVTVLSGFSFGVAAARCCTLSAVAEAVPALGKPDTVERRRQRFLANPRLDWAQGCQALATWVLSQLSGRGPVAACKQAGGLPCWAEGRWPPGPAEPWLRLTNHPATPGAWYGMRLGRRLSVRLRLIARPPPLPKSVVY